jgi:flagellin-like hook-associated protein FlgL
MSISSIYELSLASANSQSLTHLNNILKKTMLKTDTSAVIKKVNEIVAQVDTQKANILTYSDALNNTQSATSFVSYASDKVKTIKSLLSDVQSLTTEATQSGITTAKRNALQAIADAKLAEIKNIQETTTYNGASIFTDSTTTTSTTTSTVDLIKPVTNQTTAPDGYIAITSAEEFFAQLEGATSNDKFILMNDIDFSGYTESIASFNGTLDGNGYTLENLTVDAGSGNYALFTATDGATFKDLKIENFNLSGKSVAGLVLSADNSTFDNIGISDSTINSSLS